MITHPVLLLQDYIFTEGDLVFQPGETRKEVQVPLLELTEIDALLHNSQLKQFAIDLLHPKHGAKIGRYPQTTVTIADPGRGWQPGAGNGGGRGGTRTPRWRTEPGPAPPARPVAAGLPLQALARTELSEMGDDAPPASRGETEYTRHDFSPGF